MKSEYTRLVVFNLVVGVYLSYQYGVLSYLGVLMMMATHELGHYMCAVLKGKSPKFIVSSGGNWGIRYRGKHGEYSVLIAAGGMIVNFLFLPLFVGMEIMDMDAWWVALLIIGGSISDIIKIVKELRKK